MASLFTDLLGWVVIATFLAGAGVEYVRRHRVGGEAGALATLRRRLDGFETPPERTLATAGWVLFAAFWLALFPHFAFTQKSYVEGVLSLLAVPASLYAGWLLWTGRDSLLVLSRAVAAMGIVYFPFESVEPLKRGLVLVVTEQTGWAMAQLGYHPTRVTGPILGYHNAYRFVTAEGHGLVFEIVLACTGLGSMAIFAGLIAAVRAPLGRKLRGLAVSIPTIWLLNIVRTTFIGIAFGNQYLQLFVDEVLFLFGSSDPYMVSFFLSDRVISQVLAVVALVGITYLVVRELPELVTVIEDVLYMVTNEEYDLLESLDLPREPVRADGGGSDADER
ncbi:archaeosortase A [Halobaculum gomorrense]|uniref:Archaeosortase A, PGF-CTERM-specific n=1 Tax=Halobaculum gomorrense TaxID=43928 RepID=A0A1M5JCR0_9EURY|nr:archaeosortase A [Halobaculum gomorrense]SHG38281.1 archaeosortase A, PGF-CTERM-specific [Halobaculum gomorrense]